MTCLRFVAKGSSHTFAVFLEAEPSTGLINARVFVQSRNRKKWEAPEPACISCYVNRNIKLWSCSWEPLQHRLSWMSRGQIRKWQSQHSTITQPDCRFIPRLGNTWGVSSELQTSLLDKVLSHKNLKVCVLRSSMILIDLFYLSSCANSFT